MHWFKRGISKDQKWTPFFPSLPSSPSHTHSSHSLCDNHSLDERRGPPWPSITYRRCDNPCVRFMAMFKVQLLQSKISHIVFCVLRVCVCVYKHRMLPTLLSAGVFEADLVFGALCLHPASCKFAFMQTVIFVYVVYLVFLLHLISLKLMMGQPALQGEIILLGIIPS